MKILSYLCVSLIILVHSGGAPRAASFIEENSQNSEEFAQYLAPHKALYDINLVATRSGSQVVNISGKMFYEWAPTCDAWITDHRFSLFYEYADSPAMRVTSDFSTFETFDGTGFNLSLIHI